MKDREIVYYKELFEESENEVKNLKKALREKDEQINNLQEDLKGHQRQVDIYFKNSQKLQKMLKEIEYKLDSLLLILERRYKDNANDKVCTLLIISELKELKSSLKENEKE